MICSTEALWDAEVNKIRETMVNNGYTRKFIEKAISKQSKRATPTAQTDPDRPKLITTTIPYVDGLSQEVRRLVRAVNVRCAFTMPSTLSFLYNAKDRLTEEYQTHAVYSVKCRTCTQEYVGETMRTLGVRKKEHKDAIRLGQDAKSAIADHVNTQTNPHEIDWDTLRKIDSTRGKMERKFPWPCPFMFGSWQ